MHTVQVAVKRQDVDGGGDSSCNEAAAPIQVLGGEEAPPLPPQLLPARGRGKGMGRGSTHLQNAVAAAGAGAAAV